MKDNYSWLDDLYKKTHTNRAMTGYTIVGFRKVIIKQIEIEKLRASKSGLRRLWMTLGENKLLTSEISLLFEDTILDLTEKLKELEGKT